MAMSSSCANKIREVDMEDINNRFQRAMEYNIDEPGADDVERWSSLILKILDRDKDYQAFSVFAKLLRENKCNVKRSFLFHVFLRMKETHSFSEADMEYIRRVLQIKAGKSHSGINSVTVFTSGHPEWKDPVTGAHKKQNFSCAFDCAFCPTEPGQPKSYLSLEPGVLRANRAGFDCVTQMWARMKALYLCGHDCDKLEVLVLGGTWTSYPSDYREQFIRDIYYGANTFFEYFNKDGNMRERLSLDEEKRINKTTRCKVIGLTLETRPDTITAKELKLLRYYGCTRVQLGIQHIDDDVLNKVKRRCKTERTVKAIRLLKDCGFKIDAHFMPNLPGSTLEKDVEMFEVLLGRTSVSVMIVPMKSGTWQTPTFK